MLNPKEFKAPYIKIEEIRSIADEFRKKYWHSNSIPVDIFAILEFELDIEISTIPNLREAGDIDALLLANLKTIVVDQRDFLDERAQTRLRFSIAHEIGHLVLHSNIFSKINYSSLEDWIQFLQKIPDDQYTWIEQHAYEFVPGVCLFQEKNL